MAEYPSTVDANGRSLDGPIAPTAGLIILLSISHSPSSSSLAHARKLTVKFFCTSSSCGGNGAKFLRDLFYVGGAG